jgi:purine-binding chemotaxis protein CheW
MLAVETLHPDKTATREYLTFRVASEEYAIPILHVQEIRSYETPTRIANAPRHLKGVVNLRGVIVPIIDLRLKLGAADATYDALTVVIVLSVEDRTVGAVVDSVSDVLELPPEAIRPAPEMHVAIPDRFVEGIGNLGDRMLILVDIEKLLMSPEMAIVG